MMRFLDFYLIIFLLINSCTYNTLIPGCIDPSAINYNQEADVNDGSCIYTTSSTCLSDPIFLECVFPIFEEHCINCHFHENPYGIMPLTNFTEIQDNIVNGTIIESIKREIGFMPKNGEKLSAEEILIIEKWYENGTLNN